MKHLYLFVACWLIIIGTVCGQAKKPVSPSPGLRQSPELKGLGIFKIGKPITEILDTLKAQLGAEVQPVTSYVDILTADYGTILEIKPDSSEELTSEYARYCPEARVLALSNYTVAGISITNLYLTFYKGLLCRIDMAPMTEMEEALTIKYGKPTTSVASSTVTCTYKLTGRNFTNKAYTLKKTWQNGPIQITDYFKSYFDSDCKEHSISYFVIRNNTTDAALSSCKSVAKVRYKQEQAKLTKKRLSDL